MSRRTDNLWTPRNLKAGYSARFTTSVLGSRRGNGVSPLKRLNLKGSLVDL